MRILSATSVQLVDRTGKFAHAASQLLFRFAADGAPEVVVASLSGPNRSFRAHDLVR